jgi:predicted transcriptional regulator
MIALLSVKPEYAERIFNGTKKYEYRKKIFARTDIDKVVVYASSPLKQVIGEFEYDHILENTPFIIWEQTFSHSGIDREAFFEYFSGKQNAYAISIKHTIRYPKPLNPQHILPSFVVPQSFRYIMPREFIILNEIVKDGRSVRYSK